MQATEPGEEIRPGVRAVVAPNPGPMTLDGTNTWVVDGGSGAVWIIDPGPADPGHIERVRSSAQSLGAIEAAVLTHSHLDHSEAVSELGAPLAFGSPQGSDEAQALMAVSAVDPIEPVPPSARRERSTVGPFDVIPTPGHAADHVAFSLGRVCFCGDLILGSGSSIVPPRAAGGSLADYMLSLDRLEALEPELLLPGHGPPISDPGAKIASYRAHRQEREGRLMAALGAGERSRRALLAEVWDDVPEMLHAAAALAMRAHLEKLAADGLALDGLTD